MKKHPSLFTWLAACAALALTNCSGGNSNEDSPAAAAEPAKESPAAEAEAEPKAEEPAPKPVPSSAEGKPVAVTAADFESVVSNAEQVVLVDFWAEWCQPCHLIAPEVDKVAAKYAGRVLVVKVDLTESPGDSFTDKYGIEFLPTLLIFKNGKTEGNLVSNGKPMPDAESISAALDEQL